MSATEQFWFHVDGKVPSKGSTAVLVALKAPGFSMTLPGVFLPIGSPAKAQASTRKDQGHEAARPPCGPDA